MATSKSKKSNQKYLIVAVGLALATAGYFGYKSMLTSPDINKIAPPERPRPTKIPRKTPNPTSRPPQKTPVGTVYKTPSPSAKAPLKTPAPTTKPKYTPAPNIQPAP